MFGFQGGERPDILTRKKGYRQDAKDRWGFLTHFDLSTIKNEAQLATMVQGRSSLPEAEAKSDVQAWMQGKQFT
jgi:hypothetical protein